MYYGVHIHIPKGRTRSSASRTDRVLASGGFARPGLVVIVRIPGRGDHLNSSRAKRRPDVGFLVTRCRSAGLVGSEALSLTVGLRKLGPTFDVRRTLWWVGFMQRAASLCRPRSASLALDYTRSESPLKKHTSSSQRLSGGEASRRGL